jgi:peptide/nickel transport system ATP-binding protein
VIYLGRIVEQGRPEDLFNRCAHPYTRALLEAVPRARPGRARQRRGPQAIASQSVGSTGCAYAARCPFADAHCGAVAPIARNVGAGHFSACHHAETVMALPPLAGEA